MYRFGVAEWVFRENFGDLDAMCGEIRRKMASDPKKLRPLSTDELLSNRYGRFRKFGIYEENGVRHGAAL